MMGLIFKVFLFFGGLMYIFIGETLGQIVRLLYNTKQKSIKSLFVMKSITSENTCIG